MSLSADDIVPEEKKKQTVFSFLSSHLRQIVLVLCLAVLIGSLVRIFDSLRHYAMADSIYHQIENEILGEGGAEMMYAAAPSLTTPDYAASQSLTEKDLSDYTNTDVNTINKEFERVRNKLVTLKQQYPNLYGWISIPGTNISYPVMQSYDNSYYLTRSYTGSSLKAGSIFADFRCSRELMRNYNLVVYGHHMTNNSMFHALDNYLNEDFFRKNKTIIVYTLDGMFTYEIFSIFETNKYYDYIQTDFYTRASFVSFANEMAGNSIFRTGRTFTESDRLITLSTCNNRTEDGRLAVQGVMVEYYLSPST